MDLAANQERDRQAASQLESAELPSPRRSWPALAELGLRCVRTIAQSESLLARRRQGRIVVENGRLEGISGRWWPYQGTLLHAWYDQRFRNFPRDRCELFYHAPFRSGAFLTLDYVRSGPKTTLSTFYAATLVLDEIARLKETGALVCQVTNDRIRDRLMKRWGWEAHCDHMAGRNFIKRFYDGYPDIPSIWRERLTMSL